MAFALIRSLSKSGYWHLVGIEFEVLYDPFGSDRYHLGLFSALRALNGLC